MAGYCSETGKPNMVHVSQSFGGGGAEERVDRPFSLRGSIDAEVGEPELSTMRLSSEQSGGGPRRESVDVGSLPEGMPMASASIMMSLMPLLNVDHSGLWPSLILAISRERNTRSNMNCPGRSESPGGMLTNSADQYGSISSMRVCTRCTQ